MPIQIDASAMEAKYGSKTGAPAQPAPMQDLYAPGVRPEHQGGPNQQAQIPTGSPIPEGTVIRQLVGRGQTSMMVVPPKQPEVNAPGMAVVPPTGSPRTTIGTFVEAKSNAMTDPDAVGTFIEVSQTKSNPMTASPPPINSGIIDAPVVQENLPERKKKLDLTQAILDHMFELGGEKSEECQKFYDRSPQTLLNWQRNPATIPLGAITRFLQRAPEVRADVLELLEPHFAFDGDNGTTSLPNRGRMSVMVCAPVLERPTLPFLWCLLYLAKKYEIGFDVQSDTMIDRSRNMLAKRFLESGCQWSLWIDGDIAAPIANPDWYRWVTRSTTVANESCSFDVLERLLSHRKAVIGGIYASRWYHGQLVIQPELKPRSHEDKLLANQIRAGNQRGLVEVDWVGFGCCLVHREVFLEVQRRFPQLAPQSEIAPWGFFDKDVGQGLLGEDEAFCQRVRSCAIPVHLDTQLVCGHIGSMCYLPEHTASLMAL